MAFQIGDTVQLKSGGPLMTVDNIDVGEEPHVMITCLWFEKTDRKVGQFKAPALEFAKKTIGGLASSGRPRRR
jgi:uncharacterized protein YodC (DUF2158 family)